MRVQATASRTFQRAVTAKLGETRCCALLLHMFVLPVPAEVFDAHPFVIFFGVYHSIFPGAGGCFPQSIYNRVCANPATDVNERCSGVLFTLGRNVGSSLSKLCDFERSRK